MSKQIEDILNLPRLEDALKEAGIDPADVLDDEDLEEPDPEVEAVAEALKNSHELEKSLGDPEGTNEHTAEMDDVYKAAMRSHKDILDLGFNVEAKQAASMFAASAKFLELAMKASTNKTDARTNRIKLAMEQKRLAHELKQNQEDGVIEGEAPVTGQLADRNDMMAKLRKPKT